MHDTLALPAELTIYTVAELRPVWLAWLAAAADADSQPVHDELNVDAAAVEQTDAAGIQLLASLAKSCKARQLQLRLHRPSRVLRAACVTLGLDRLLVAESTGVTP